MQGKNKISKEIPEVFYAKILLFGEYSVIFGSMALSIPFSHFTAGFSFLNRNKYTDHNFAVRSNAMLKEYCSWLEVANGKGRYKDFFDTGRFKYDIEQGLFLESNIPQGYGLGSSGALCAAVYNRYACQKIDNGISTGPEEMRELKKIFAYMESWFHGTSSGLDPLNCYFRLPVLVEPGERISLTGVPNLQKEKGYGIFLIDTGGASKTEPLVSHFMEKSLSAHFRGMIDNVLIPPVNKCIGSIIKPDLQVFMTNLKTLSRFQLDHMNEMIPPEFIDVWKNGIESEEYFIKLCGSGGGGYLLGFTADMKKTTGIMAKENLKILPVFMSTKMTRN